MKNPIPMPVVIGVVVAVVAVVAIFFVKGAAAEPHTPRPDPAMFNKSAPSGPPQNP